MSAAHIQTNSPNGPNHSGEGLTSNLFNMLSTTVEWMLDTNEMDKNYHACKLEIDRLEKLPRNELARLGITRDQIPVYVFSNLFGIEQNSL